MKVLDQKRQERSLIMGEIANMDLSNPTEEITRSYDEKETKVKSLDNEIARLERQEEISVKLAGMDIRNKEDGEEKELKNDIKKAFAEYARGGKVSSEFRGIQDQNAFLIPTSLLRANPVVTTTDTGLIPRLSAQLNIGNSGAENFLRSVGATIYTGLTANLPLSSAAEFQAYKMSEVTDTSTFGFSPASNVLAPNAFGGDAYLSKQLLVQTSDIIFSKFVDGANNAIWNAFATDTFAKLKAQTTQQVKTIKGTTLAWVDVVGLDASITYLPGKMGYVTTNAVEGFLATTAALTNQGPMLVNGQIYGRPAYGIPFVQAKHLYYSVDWSKLVLAQFGSGIEIIVDPYTYASKAGLKVAGVGMFDAGVADPRYFCSIADVSIA